MSATINYLEALRTLIEQHRAELTDAVADLMWTGYGRPEACITITEDGEIVEHENASGVYYPGEVVIWRSSGMEYASPYELWELSDWTDAIACTVGADYLDGVLEDIATEAGAENAADYVKNYEQYEKIDKVLQCCAPLRRIYDMIDDDIKDDSAAHRREAAEMAIDASVEEIIKRIEELESYAEK